jgi:phosphoribosyl 1,2-cyclic phosphodiesterase
MTLKTLATGSTGNCYILTSDTGKHLILDAGIPIAEIKKGIDFDVENVDGCLISHFHKDHLLSADKVSNFTPVWKPYLSEHKRQHTHLGSFDIQSFDVPHNGCECRAFLITVDNTRILYCTDAEYIPYSLKGQNINVMLIECNYISDLVKDENTHREHVFKGHMELETTLGVIKDNIKHLRKVILCHMSMSGSLDRDKAMERIREEVPDYISVEWAKAGNVTDISEIPF